ncbi:MAG: aldo/keto reductase [Eggerthellaceae bacterium]|nr:aldo/keto reductase [Eggerthellaceae bacterium]
MALELENASPLGFGCMRFVGRTANEIDIDLVSRMVDHYLQSGGNYFDTAWAYPNSEAALGKALVARHPRDSFLIATKCVAWNHCTCTADLEAQLEESLANLGTDYVDVYLMHNLGGARTDKFRAYKAWDFLKSAKERGLVRHIGFSAHCTPEELETFLVEFPETEVVQLQINYADWDNPSYRERECVEIANRHQVPIIAMEPIKGGILADPPAAIRDLLAQILPEESPATAALRFASTTPGVLTTLSGMNTMEMVEENCASFARALPLSPEQRSTFESFHRIMSESGMIGCTGCDYCAKVCPQGIGISGALTALNYLINFEDPFAANQQLGTIVGFMQGKKMPSECIGCGACEEACPQNIPILECFERIEREIVPFQQAGESVIKR